MFGVVLNLVNIPRPLAVQDSVGSDWPALRQMLYESGVVEEGEIFEPTREQIAEFLGICPDDVHLREEPTTENDFPESTANPEEEVADDVEIEDETEERYSTGQSSGSDDLPDLPEFFKRHSEEEVRQKAKEKAKKGNTPVQDTAEDDQKKVWKEMTKGWFKRAEPIAQPSYTLFHNVLRRRNKGRIISWAYLSDMKVFAVKRDIGGVEYYERASDLKTLPYPDMHQLARLDLINSEADGMASWLEKKIKQEFRTGWNESSILKPQFPQVIQHQTRLHPITGQKAKIVKFKAPRTMRKAPVRKMLQNFHKRFKWWFYDGRTQEAVIVLKDGNGWELIRMLDPLWIRNCSAKDVEILYYHCIDHEEQDRDQAILYDRVASICYVMDVDA